MLIDLLFAGFIILAVFNGIRKGLVVALFSLVGWILGLFAAFKFSDLAAEYLDDVISVSESTLSIISFVVVFAIVVLLVNLGAKIIEKTMELTLLGWVNRLGGIFFYVLLYTFIFSVLIFFAEKTNLVNEEATSSSKVYQWVKPLAQIVQRPFLD
jgi:membrane protein required for colicin V production